MAGKESKKLNMTAGITNMPACVRIKLMKPNFVRPISRITPNSNVFVSTEMRRSE